VSGPVIGVDLGTVNSCVAVVRGGKPEILGDEGSRALLPSCISFQGDRELVGAAAKRHAATDPHATVIAVKRLLGHPFDSDIVRRAAKRLPYPVKPSPLGSVLLEVAGRELTPVQVSARILRDLRERAERVLGCEVSRAVVAVPAHFTDVQRKATKLAAEYAGLEVLRLVNEPTAAAFAYGYKKERDFTLAVYDLGGGTFDVTLMRAVGDTFQVVATDGDPFLGGEDVDQAIAGWLEAEFEAETGSDLAHDVHARLRLKEAAERAKVELAAVERTSIELPFLTQLPDGRRPSFSRALTREKLEELARPVVERTLALCRRCLEAAHIDPKQLDEVLLVGGQSRMPLVRAAVRDFFRREPRRDINPDEVVALGAALYAYSLVVDELQEGAQAAAGESYEVAVRSTEVVRKLVDEVEQYREKRAAGTPAADARLQELLKAAEQIDPEHLEIERAGLDVERVRRPAATDPDLPRTSDRDLPQAVAELRDGLMELDWKAADVIERLAAQNANDPRAMEIIEQARALLERNLGHARDAAEQAQELSAEAREHRDARRVQLRDVTSLPLGIAATGDLFSELIAGNTAIPVQQQRVFATSQDGQTEVEIRVFQGREQRCRDNQLLGSFILQGIEPAARMTKRIDVAFRIDESGILSVQARDADSGAVQGMRVEDPLGLQQVEPEAGFAPAAPSAAVPAGSPPPQDERDVFDFTGARELDPENL
jgi:molecular chaperone DnaK